MKRIILLLLLAVPTLLLGAATTMDYVYHLTGDVTVDSQATGDWECLDSIILTTADSSSIVLVVSGVAEMNAWDKLYLGVGTAADSFDYNTDTANVYPPFFGSGTCAYPFVYRYVYQHVAGATDTFYFNAACGGSSGSEAVKLYDVVVEAFITDDTL